MAKKMLIDASHPEETRVVVADGNKVEEFDFESMNRRQLAGNIYLAKVTRVEPSLQAAFVDYGGNRHGFLAFSEIHPDYYQIPKADRDAILAEEQAEAEAAAAEEEKPTAKPKRARRSRSRKKSDENGETSSEEQSDASLETSEDTAADANADDAVADVSVETAVETAAEVAEMPGVAEPEAPAAEPVVEAAGNAVTEAPAEASSEATAKSDDTPPTSIAEDTGIEDAVISQDPEDMGGDDADDAPTGDVVADPEPVAEAAPAAPEAVEVVEAEASIPGMDVVEPDEDASSDDVISDDASPVDTPEAAPVGERPKRGRRKSTAAEKDETVETVADDDDVEEIRPVRRPRARRYKIQEVVKVRQVMLVQVVKEERGNKGAALTTYLSLAGRYCVLMPNTARGGGISRKITNAPDRKKLKEIANEIDVPKGAGLIIRTAGAKRTKTEIKRDYEYLQRQWEQIRALTLQSIAPAQIYEEGNLIRRSIRDLYNRDIDEVIVEGEAGYRHAKDFMKMIMPSHAKNVKHHNEGMPLFARYQVESYLSGMFNPTVQLKSGGYIVIGITEALVAIDVNSGKATKEGSIEDTATKTNLEAADEVARQLRLRDLAGLIVIDFIDMDERRNNAAVEKRIKDALKNDRARIQVGRISGFGLMELSRQRLRPGMLEATTQPCPACHGTGLIRSDDSLALSILRALEEEGTRKRSREVLLKLPVDVANYIMNDKREHLAMIEARYAMAVRIQADPHLIAPDYTLEKFKTATRVLPKVSSNVVSMDSALMDEIDDADVVEDISAEDEAPEVIEETTPNPTPEAGDGEGAPKKRRRRRSRRRKGGNGDEATGSEGEGQQDGSAEGVSQEAAEDASAEPVTEAAPEGEAEEKPAKKRRARTRRKKPDVNAEDATDAPQETAATAEPVAEPATEETPAASVVETAVEAEAPVAEKPKAKKRVRAKAPAPTVAVVAEVAEVVSEPIAAAEQEPQVSVELVEAVATAPEPEPVAEAPAEAAAPKRRGWWSKKS